MRYLLILTACVLICACNKENPEQSSRVRLEIRNLSSQDVELFLYDRVNELAINESIASMDSAIVEEGFIHPAPGGPTYLLTSSNLDSAVIVFDDGKKLVQTSYARSSYDSINNILHPTFYKGFIDESATRLQFTISNSDYDRAE